MMKTMTRRRSVRERELQVGESKKITHVECKGTLFKWFLCCRGKGKGKAPDDDEDDNVDEARPRKRTRVASG